MQQLSLLNEFSPPPPADYSPADLMNQYIPYDAVECLLEEHLEIELEYFEMLDVSPAPETNFTAKWKYSSALQKSIRRGYVADSIQYAQTYHAIDPTGFWTRIVVIAFEDVGVGDIWAVASTLAIARSKSFRQRLGGETLCVQYIIKKLTEAVKDRTVCDLFQVLENRPRNPETLIALQSATSQDLSDIALSDKYPFESRICAAWCLFGTGKLKNDRLPYRVGERNLFDSTIERLKVPGLVQYITLRGMIACRCAMNLTFPFVWLMMEKSEYRRVIETELPEPFYIGGVPDFAFDMHTIQGKRAYHDFYRTCEPVQNFLTSLGVVGNDAIVRAISVSVFIGESALLGKRLDFAGSTEIYEMTVEDDYIKFGLNPEGGKILTKLILENAETLRLSRQKVLAGK